MNIPIKHIAVTLGLILGFAAPPANAESIPPLKTAQPPQWAIQIQMAEPIVVDEIKPLEPLKMADFKYAPMGTYSSSFEPANCTWGVASMKGNITWSGNAREWDDKARAQGKVVSDVPVVGSVGVSNDGYYGHVVLTTAVSGGMVQVMEMNWDNQGSVRSHWYPVTQFVYIYI